LTKAENIYWDNGRAGSTATRRAATARRPRANAQRKARRRAPWWLSLLIVTSIFVMLTVSINFRAFREMRDEAEQNTRLSSQIQNLMDENLTLQEEIHTIKSDPRVIEREAKKLGLDLKTNQ
jgi:cell division protein FtsL